MILRLKLVIKIIWSNYISFSQLFLVMYVDAYGIINNIHKYICSQFEQRTIFSSSTVTAFGSTVTGKHIGQVDHFVVLAVL